MPRLHVAGDQVTTGPGIFSRFSCILLTPFIHKLLTDPIVGCNCLSLMRCQNISDPSYLVAPLEMPRLYVVEDQVHHWVGEQLYILTP